MEFKLFRLNELEGTQYIEVCNKLEYKCWNSEAIYFIDDVFDCLFSTAIRKIIGDRYSIYSFMELSNKEVNCLYSILKQNQKKINKMRALDDFINSLSQSELEYKLPDISDFDNSNDVQIIISQVRVLHKQFTQYVKKTLDENRSLWILGL